MGPDAIEFLSQTRFKLSRVAKQLHLYPGVCFLLKFCLYCPKGRGPWPTLGRLGRFCVLFFGVPKAKGSQNENTAELAHDAECGDDADYDHDAEVAHLREFVLTTVILLPGVGYPGSVRGG